MSDTPFAEAFLQIMTQRHSKRAFTQEPVSKDILQAILHAAAHAPSSKNTQPWQVAVLMNQQVQDFSQMLCQLFDQQVPQQADYTYTIEPLAGEFLDRARACGFGLFALKGIERKDREARKAHDRENFELFGAPAYMLFHLPENSTPGMFLDLGFFMQNVMLGLVAYGLASCPQFSVASYPQAIREHLGLDHRWIISGLAIGHPQQDALINSYIPERLDLDEFVQWFDTK